MRLRPLFPPRAGIKTKSKFRHKGKQSVEHSTVNGVVNVNRIYWWSAEEGRDDTIDHDLLIKAITHYCKDKWVLLYIKRWIIAPYQHADGSLTERKKGIPQGAVISPLLANLFLHYCMDEWLRMYYPDCPFERYADDSVIHCKTEAQAVLVCITRNPGRSDAGSRCQGNSGEGSN